MDNYSGYRGGGSGYSGYSRDRNLLFVTKSMNPGKKHSTDNAIIAPGRLCPAHTGLNNNRYRERRIVFSSAQGVVKQLHPCCASQQQKGHHS